MPLYLLPSDVLPGHLQGWSLGFGALPLTHRFTGFRLGRDNWVSVRYAGELNSGKSSVLLQRADRHGILGQKLPDFQVSL